MSDEATTADVTEVAADQVQATAPAEAKNTDTQQTAEHMIPKSRFDEVNAELKRLKAQSTAETKQREAAEAERMKEAGEFKALYEKAQAVAQAAEAKAKALELATMQRQAADDVGLPPMWADRIRGETFEDMQADARALSAAMPKPTVPNINSAPGVGSAPVPGQMTPEQKIDLAARYGVSAKYL